MPWSRRKRRTWSKNDRTHTMTTKRSKTAPKVSKNTSKRMHNRSKSDHNGSILSPSVAHHICQPCLCSLIRSQSERLTAPSWSFRACPACPERSEGTKRRTLARNLVVSVFPFCVIPDLIGDPVSLSLAVVAAPLMAPSVGGIRCRPTNACV